MEHHAVAVLRTGCDCALWAIKGAGGSESMRCVRTAVKHKPMSFRVVEMRRMGIAKGTGNERCLWQTKRIGGSESTR